ncbi:4Fe-4S binding protein, partial [bacterium]|nr:4Fe-4S binding protein [bacterium]
MIFSDRQQNHSMRKWATFFLLCILIYSIPYQLFSQIQRFPKPEFESGYVVPTPTTPHPRQDIYEYLDVAVLIIALSLASYLALKKRSRNGIFLLTLFSLLYFGFWRKGCVCAIGSIQNISMAVFDHTYIIPITVIAFFTIPLLFTLFFGRTFCAAVCPLGMIQDVVILKPMKIPPWLQKVLGFIPHIYLGLAVLLAAYGADFIICRYDP